MISFSTILLILLLVWPAMSLFPYLQGLVSRTLGLTDSSGPSDSPPASMSQSPLDVSKEASHHHEPSAMDVVVVKMMLQQGARLPPEIVLSVLDFAEYWPHNSVLMDRPFTTVSGRSTENKFVLRSKPLGFIKKTHYADHLYSFTAVSPEPLSSDGEYPASQFQDWIGSPVDTIQRPCRKIVFTITSHDQGWAHNARNDRGSYRGSWTWFEAGLERLDRHAQGPKDSAEKEAGRSHDSAAQDADAGPSVPVPVPATPPAAATAGESDATAATITPPAEEEELPNPYLPLYALRSIYPVVETDASALHHDLHPSPQYTIQRNKTAIREPTTHQIVWHWKDDANPLTAEQLEEVGRGRETGTGAFVRDLKLGDVVTVWAKSRFGAWANHVESVRLDIYWAL